MCAIGWHAWMPFGVLTNRICMRCERVAVNTPGGPHTTRFTGMCPCEDREARCCPGEWEPGCDLGNNPMFMTACDPWELVDGDEA